MPLTQDNQAKGRLISLLRILDLCNSLHAGCRRSPDEEKHPLVTSPTDGRFGTLDEAERLLSLARTQIDITKPTCRHPRDSGG